MSGPDGSAGAVPPTETELRALLTGIASSLVACGLPVDEVEEDVQRVAIRFGAADPQVVATPTSVTVALARGAAAAVERVGPPLRLEQVADVTLARHQLLADELPWREVRARLEGLRTAPSRVPPWIRDLSWVVVAMGITLLMQPGWANLAVAGAAALLVVGLIRVSRHSRTTASLLPAIAAFAACTVVLLAAQAGWIDGGALRTVFPAIAILLPGGLLFTGISELIASQMVAGTARLAFAVMQLAMAASGILIAVQLVHPDPALLVNARIDQLGLVAPLLGVVLIGGGIVLNEAVDIRMLPWILLVLATTVAAQILGQLWAPGTGVGTFLGATAAVVGSRVVAVLRPRLSRLVVFLPSFWVLVPGSLGLLTVSQVELSPEQAVQTGGEVLTAIAAIMVGLIFGSAFARAASAALRRVRLRRKDSRHDPGRGAARRPAHD